MRITLNLDESILRRLEGEAHEQGRTTSDLVESALGVFLEKTELPPLPTFSGGRLITSVESRDALYGSMEES